MNTLFIDIEDITSTQKVNELLDNCQYITAQALAKLQITYPGLYSTRCFTPIELEGFYRIGGPGLL